MDPQGNHIGYMAEREQGVRNTMARQMFRTHRSFTTHVFNRNEEEVLRVSIISLQGGSRDYGSAYSLIGQGRLTFVSQVLTISSFIGHSLGYRLAFVSMIP